MQKDQNGPRKAGRRERKRREEKDRELGAAYKSCQRWEGKDSNKTKKKNMENAQINE